MTARDAGRTASSSQTSSSPTACPQMDDEVGYRGAVAARAAGITYRQLDYWARTELVEPTVRGASGLRIAAALRLPRHPRAQARQATARHRHLAAADPHGRRSAARVRHPRPRRHDAHERRRIGLPVHLERRGHRPRQPRPGRLRHRRRQGAARGRVDARRVRRAGARRRWTSSPRAAPSAPPDAHRTHACRPARHAFDALAACRRSVCARRRDVRRSDRQTRARRRRGCGRCA